MVRTRRKEYEVCNKANHWHPIEWRGTKVVGPREIPGEVGVITAAGHGLERLVVVGPQTRAILWSTVRVHIAVTTGQVSHAGVTVPEKRNIVSIYERTAGETYPNMSHSQIPLIIA